MQSTVVQGGEYEEVQTIDISNASGGTFRLAFDGEVTDVLSTSASASTIQSALNALVFKL